MESITGIERRSRSSLCALTRQDFLCAALALAATPLLRYVPAGAAPRLEVSEIAPGIFVHQGRRDQLQSPENRGDMANASFVVGSDAVAVIDTLGSALAGRELRDAVRAATDTPVKYVINTHMHPDHVFGNAAFKQDGPAFVGHYKLARGLASRADRYLAINKIMLGEDAFEGIEIVLPTLAVEKPLILDLGGRTLLLEAQPTAHTDNDLIVTDTASNTLFLGDLLFSEHVPTLDGSIRGWLALIDELGRRDAARVVPGHGPHAMQLPAALTPEERYLSADRTRRRQEIDQRGQNLRRSGDSDRRVFRARRLEIVRSLSRAKRHRGLAGSNGSDMMRWNPCGRMVPCLS